MLVCDHGGLISQPERGNLDPSTGLQNGSRKLCCAQHVDQQHYVHIKYCIKMPWAFCSKCEKTWTLMVKLIIVTNLHSNKKVPIQLCGFNHNLRWDFHSTSLCAFEYNDLIYFMPLIYTWIRHGVMVASTAQTLVLTFTIYITLIFRLEEFFFQSQLT